mmetsp:Transcript_105515/g.297195  ORF Transcript_105515/g.297195 Transcript_105515/m.297195 type:complete len:326 (+) Transcript_105515:462-1439(+)
MASLALPLCAPSYGGSAVMALEASPKRSSSKPRRCSSWMAVKTSTGTPRASHTAMNCSLSAAPSVGAGLAGFAQVLTSKVRSCSPHPAQSTAHFRCDLRISISSPRVLSTFQPPLQPPMRAWNQAGMKPMPNAFWILSATLMPIRPPPSLSNFGSEPSGRMFASCCWTCRSSRSWICAAAKTTLGLASVKPKSNLFAYFAGVFSNCSSGRSPASSGRPHVLRKRQRKCRVQPCGHVLRTSTGMCARRASSAVISGMLGKPPGIAVGWQKSWLSASSSGEHLPSAKKVAHLRESSTASEQNSCCFLPYSRNCALSCLTEARKHTQR